MRRFARVFQTVGVALAAFVPGLAAGQTFTWNNGTGDFTDSSQWVGSIGPVVPGADTLVFGGTGAAYTATNNFSSTSGGLQGFYLNQLDLTGPAVAAMTIQGTGAFPQAVRMTFTGTGAAINYTGAGDYSMPHTLQLQSDLAINVAPGAGTLTIDDPATDPNMIFGPGSLSITNNSSNPVILGNLGAFAGNINVLAGTVRAVVGGDHFSYRSVINVAAGATYDQNSNGEELGSYVGAGTVLLGTASAQYFRPVSVTWDGSFNGTKVDTSSALIIDYAAHDSVITFTNDNPVPGGVNVRSGTLTLKDNGRLSGITLVTNLSRGGLVLDNTGSANNNDRINDASAMALSGPLVLLGANSTASSETIGGILTVGNSGPSKVSITPGSGGTADLVLAGGNAIYDIANFGNKSVVRTTARGAYVAVEGTGTVTVTNPVSLDGLNFNVNGSLGGWITRGDEFVKLDGSKQVVALVPGDYQTDSNPANWLATQNVKVTGALTGNVTASQTINSLNVASAQTLTIDAGQTLRLDNGGLLASASGTFTGGAITGLQQLGATVGIAREVTAAVRGAGTTLTVDSDITNDGANAVALTKTGDGILRLNGAKAFTGGVQAWDGVIEIDNAASLGPTTSASIIGSGGTIRLLAGPIDLVNRAVTANSGGLIFDTNGFDLRTGDSIDGAGGLTKRGAGTWTLNGANTFGGDFKVEQGAVVIEETGGSFFGASTYSIHSPGTLLDFRDNVEDYGGPMGTGGDLNLGDGSLVAVPFLRYTGNLGRDLEFAGRITGVGEVRLATPTDRAILSGPSTYTGATIIQYGSLVIKASVLNNTDSPLGNNSQDILMGFNSAQDGPASLANDQNLLLGSGGITVERNVLVRPGTPATNTVTIGGEFTSGTSTYSGSVLLGRSVNLVSAAGGTVEFSGAISDAVPPVDIGGIAKVGAGAVVLSGTNTYSGPTYVADGKLLVNGTNSGAGAVTVASDGTLGGTGTIAGAVTVFGALAPGASVGTLSVNNNVTIDGTLSVEVSGTTIDLLAITGGLSLGASSVLDIQGNLATATTHVIVSYNAGSLTGMFGDAADATGNGYNVVYENDRIILDELDGDANHDGSVDIFDINLVSSNWNPVGPVGAFAPGNVNHDTVVDIFDINFISSNWFHVATNGGPVHVQAVPEPSSLVIALIALLGLVGLVGLFRRRCQRS